MKKLTKAEEKVMQVLWKIEEGVLSDIVNEMEVPKPAYNTISTVIRVLVEKGYIIYKTYGKTNLYRPKISKKEYSTHEVDGVIRKYFNNSPKSLLSFLVKENDIDIQDLDDIIKHLSQDDKK